MLHELENGKVLQLLGIFHVPVFFIAGKIYEEIVGTHKFHEPTRTVSNCGFSNSLILL